MTTFLIAALGQTIIKLSLGAMAVFLILLVLVQRGRGGGLAGALGGMGGSSAFGAKAGDVFTRVTIVAATIWIFLCIGAAKMSPSGESRIKTNTTGPAASTTIETPAITSAEDAEQSESDSEAGTGAAAETTTESPPAESTEAAADKATPGDATQP